MFCEYGKILSVPIGEVGKGIHSYRLFNIAYMDVLVVAIGAYLIAYSFKLNMVYTFVAVFLLGIISHRVFCIRTTVDKLLFP